MRRIDYEARMSLPGPTLCIDVGGSGVKHLLLDERGAPMAKAKRVPLPNPAEPEAVIETIVEVASTVEHFERVSVGFPGVVVDDIVRRSSSFGKGWKDVPLGRELQVRLERMVKVANDTDVRGLGIVEGAGVEIVITLGSGMGSALFADGRLVPNFQLGLHPFTKKHTYQEYVGRNALDAVGVKRWSKRVLRVLDQVRQILNPRTIYLGGGNAKRLKIPDVDDVQIVKDPAGLVGGFRLWT